MTRLHKTGYSIADIAGCYLALKCKPAWRNKFLSLAVVYQFLGAYLVDAEQFLQTETYGKVEWEYYTGRLYALLVELGIEHERTTEEPVRQEEVPELDDFEEESEEAMWRRIQREEEAKGLGNVVKGEGSGRWCMARKALAELMEVPA